MSGNQEPRRIVPTSVEGGVWSNRIEVVWSPNEFTLDCWRVDYAASPPARMVLVARVACPEAVVASLLDALPEAWERQMRGMLPPTE